MAGSTQKQACHCGTDHGLVDIEALLVLTFAGIRPLYGIGSLGGRSAG